MVLDGIFVVIRDGKPEIYRTGDVFAVPAGKSHSEEIGPQGARSSPAANISGKL